MSGIIELFATTPLLLLFVVAALGYLLGHIRVGGASLGVAGVLFAGLAIGAIDPTLRLPDLVYQLGLVLFVYTVGLNSGTAFFTSLRGRGLRYNLLVLSIILVAASLAAAAYFTLGLTAAQAAGVFTGSLTNTPALAGVVEYLKASGATDATLAEPVVGYSLAYPISVLGMILAIYAAQRVWHINYRTEAANNGHKPNGETDLSSASAEIHNRTILVGTQYRSPQTISELITSKGWDVMFSRLKRDNSLALVSGKTVLQPGDLVTVVGHRADLDQVTVFLGEAAKQHLETDRTEMDFRRVYASSSRVVGRKLRDIDLPGRLGAMITRIRRGDIEIVPHGGTVLEPGDAVRVLTTNENIPAVSAFFGDSYRLVSEIDILSFSLGIASGVLLGMLPIPLPGGITITLGLAGGPLIVALILGALGRTGPVVWTLPFSANLTLRQLGLIFFLAGIGTRSGYAFYSTLTTGRGYGVLLAGIVIVAFAALAVLWIGHRLMHIPMGTLTGILAGLQTQPATLAFALQQSNDENPNIGYSIVYPIAVIAKIIIAQVLLIWLQGTP